MDCWKCRRPVSEIPIKLSFRAECPHCSIPLHVCKNCRYYSVGKPNDCAVPGTDRISDREARNFCEEFAPLGMAAHSSTDEAKKRARKLLGLEGD